jgi:hypothetical protein
MPRPRRRHPARLVRTGRVSASGRTSAAPRADRGRDHGRRRGPAHPHHQAGDRCVRRRGGRRHGRQPRRPAAAITRLRPWCDDRLDPPVGPPGHVQPRGCRHPARCGRRHPHQAAQHDSFVTSRVNCLGGSHSTPDMVSNAAPACARPFTVRPGPGMQTGGHLPRPRRRRRALRGPAVEVLRRDGSRSRIRRPRTGVAGGDPAGGPGGWLAGTKPGCPLMVRSPGGMFPADRRYARLISAAPGSGPSRAFIAWECSVVLTLPASSLPTVARRTA